ncbi:MAG: 50S ribosomal protein L6 [Minisyncoccia bacterium]
MSRIAKKGIVIPEGTTVSINGQTLSVKGPQGELSRDFSHLVNIIIEGNNISFSTKNNALEARSAIGTTAAHLKNMVKGVNEKFVKKLILDGIGYKMELQGDSIKFALGFSHPVIVEVPKGLTVTIEKNTMSISGSNKDDVGSFAARVRSQKEPEPYKGKGFRYHDEVIRRKQGKKSV